MRSIESTYSDVVKSIFDASKRAFLRDFPEQKHIVSQIDDIAFDLFVGVVKDKLDHPRFTEEAPIIARIYIVETCATLVNRLAGSSLPKRRKR